MKDDSLELEKAKKAWIELNKKKLDEIERYKRRDFRLCITFMMVNILLTLVILILMSYA